LELDVFAHVADGKRTAKAVSETAGASERGTRMILDALAGMGLLIKHGERYALAEPARRYFLRGKPDYMGEFINMSQISESWSHLTEIVRTGKPHAAVEQQAMAEEFFPKLIRGLHVVNTEPARRTAEALGVDARGGGLRVLDVACGSGIWGIAIAEADPHAHITANDFPGVLEVTREFLKRHGVKDRYDFLPGDLKEVEFGESRFDIALLGNIVHSEGERSSRNLLGRVFRALRHGGRVAIVDMIPNDSRTGPMFPLIFALNMLANTESGDTYTLAEYRQWLTEAGFARVSTADIGSHSPLIIGHKA
jgi:ubiquinone/menaquinone biosynthesis C-methylase UbiE